MVSTVRWSCIGRAGANYHIPIHIRPLLRTPIAATESDRPPTQLHSSVGNASDSLQIPANRFDEYLVLSRQLTPNFGIDSCPQCRPWGDFHIAREISTACVRFWHFPHPL